MFFDIIREAGFVEKLQEEGPFTLVAPTNKVFIIYHVSFTNKVFIINH